MPQWLRRRDDQRGTRGRSAASTFVFHGATCQILTSLGSAYVAESIVHDRYSQHRLASATALPGRRNRVFPSISEPFYGIFRDRAAGYTGVNGVYDLWVQGTAAQGQVIRQTSLSGTTFVSTQPLPAGSYRAWIRFISSVGITSAWSPVVTFSVAEVGTGATEDPDPSGLAGIAESMLCSMLVEEDVAEVQPGGEQHMRSAPRMSEVVEDQALTDSEVPRHQRSSRQQTTALFNDAFLLASPANDNDAQGATSEESSDQLNAIDDIFAEMSLAAI